MHLLLLAVHPHIRGAYIASEVRNALNVGSSPHTWGIRSIVCSIGLLSGSSPLTWGIRAHWSCWPGPFSVHPHLRGAYGVVLDQVDLDLGSSPHTWGIRGRRCNICCPGPVHPHIRGAYLNGSGAGGILYRFIPTYVGHTSVPGWRPGCRRFIPTYVGHTRESCTICKLVTVHPHIRGAYGCSEGLLVRQKRFIPTYVGHTRISFGFCLHLAVHPHIRGAYCQKLASTFSACGSSPHTWGIRTRYSRFWGYRRFIPTYVGHTVPQTLG